MNTPIHFKSGVLIILMLLLGINISYSQTGGLQGKIIDAKTNEPLIGVTVVIQDSIGTATDSLGHYEFKNLKEGKYGLKYSLTGYLKREIIGVPIENGKITYRNDSLEVYLNILPVWVVSAGKYEQKISDVTVSMQVIKQDIIEDKNTVSMEFIIDQIPGVQVVDNQPSIRGGAGWSYGAGSRVLVMMDDMPYLAADAGDVKWSALPIENINQVEVVEGASSALFGSSALNGVINIRTNYPRDTPQTKITVFEGIYDTPGEADMKWWGPTQPTYTGTSFSHSQKFGQFDLVFGGNAYNDDGYRQGEVEQRYRFNFNTRYRFKNIPGLSIGLNFNTQYSQGGNFLLWQNDSTGALKPLGGIDTIGSSLSNYTTKRTNVDPYITYYDPYGNVHKIRTRWFRSTNINDTDQGSIADLYYGEYQFQREMKKIHAIITAGFVAIENKVNSVLYNNHKGVNDAAYLQFDKKFHKLSFSLGLRGEYYSIDTAKSYSNFEDKIGTKDYKTPVIFRTGLNYELFQHTWLRTSYGQGFRYPTIGEKYIQTNVGSVYIYPNDSLQPETGWSAEVGIKQGIKIDNWFGYIDVAGFYTHYKNMMEFTFGQWGNPYTDPLYGIGFESKNIGNATISGIDASIAGRGKLGPFIMNILAGITAMNPVDDNTDSLYNENKSPAFSKFLKYRSQYLAKADVELEYKKYALGIGYRYNSFVRAVDSTFVNGNFPGTAGAAFGSVEQWRQQHPNGDFFIDGRFSYEVNNYSKIAFICKNVLNRVAMIRPGDIAPPRSLVLQYTLTF
jgi:outer membrane cobalamin receptor